MFFWFVYFRHLYPEVQWHFPKWLYFAIWRIARLFPLKKRLTLPWSNARTGVLAYGHIVRYKNLSNIAAEFETKLSQSSWKLLKMWQSLWTSCLFLEIIQRNKRELVSIKRPLMAHKEGTLLATSMESWFKFSWLTHEDPRGPRWSHFLSTYPLLHRIT